MVGKAKTFSDEKKEAVYQAEIENETYSTAAQQNSYNLGSVHFSDQSGIGNFPQSGRDQRNAALKGALFRGNVGFDLQTCLLDVGTETIDLNVDSVGTVLDVISTDRFVTLSAGTISDLRTITGAQRPGQRLRLYNTLTNTITIKHTAAATVNTIRTPTGTDITFEGNAVIDFTFDITTAQWRVVSSPGGDGTGTYTSARMDQDQSVNLTVNDHIQWNDLVENGGIVLQGQSPTFDQTSGIFELKADRIYYLSTFLDMSFTASTNVATLAFYDVTNGVEVGQRMTIEPVNQSSTVTSNSAIQTIFTPSIDVNLEVRIVALVGTITNVQFESSQISIFELSGPGGGGGISSPLTTKGDIFTYDTDDARLPVGADGEILSADSGETTGLKWIPSGSGLQTPWLSNIDANQFILFNLSDLIFTNAALNAPAAGLQSIFWSNTSGDQVHQIQPGNDFKIIEGDVETVGNTIATFNTNTIDFSVQTLPFTVLENGDLLNKGIAQFNNTVTLKTNNIPLPQPSIRPSTVVPNPNDGGDLGIGTVPWNNLNVEQIRLRDGDVIVDINSIAYDSAFSGTIYNVKQNDSHLFKEHDGAVSTNTLFEINSTEIDAFTKQIKNVVDPTLAQDAATKNYVDTTAGGTWKIPVRAKPDGFTFLFPNIQNIIDGVTLVQGDRVLLTDELNPKNNGIWFCSTAFAGIPLQSLLARPSDFNSDAEAVSEVFTAVEEGDENAKSLWHLVTPNPIQIDVDPQEWSDLTRGETTDVVIGTLDAPNNRYLDNAHEYWGNDNGSQNLGINLPTSEPVGASYQFTYTITSTDFPSGIPGFKYLQYGVFGSTQVINNDAAAANVNIKMFINDVQSDNFGGTSISAGNYGAFAGTNTTHALQVGDEISFKLWVTNAITNVDLEKVGVYVWPTIIQCKSASTTINTDNFQNEFLDGAAPVGVTISTTDILISVFPEYSIGDTENNFFSFTYVFGNPRMIFNEEAITDEDDSYDQRDTPDNEMYVPEIERFFKYRNTTKL